MSNPRADLISLLENNKHLIQNILPPDIVGDPRNAIKIDQITLLENGQVAVLTAGKVSYWAERSGGWILQREFALPGKPGAPRGHSAVFLPNGNFLFLCNNWYGYFYHVQDGNAELVNGMDECRSGTVFGEGYACIRGINVILLDDRGNPIRSLSQAELCYDACGGPHPPTSRIINAHNNQLLLAGLLNVVPPAGRHCCVAILDDQLQRVGSPFEVSSQQSSRKFMETRVTSSGRLMLTDGSKECTVWNIDAPVRNPVNHLSHPLTRGRGFEQAVFLSDDLVIAYDSWSFGENCSTIVSLFSIAQGHLCDFKYPHRCASSMAVTPAGLLVGFEDGGLICDRRFACESVYRPDAAVHAEMPAPFRAAVVTSLALAQHTPAGPRHADCGLSRLPLELQCLFFEYLASDYPGNSFRLAHLSFLASQLAPVPRAEEIRGLTSCRR